MKIVFYILLITFLLNSCKKKIKEVSTPLYSWNIDFEKPGEQFNIAGADAFQGKAFTRCGGKINNFSGGLTFVLPDSVNNCTLRVIVDYYARMVDVNFGQQLVISIQNHVKQLYWRAYNLNRYTSKTDEWVHISDSTQVLYSSDQKNTDIRVFGYNIYKKSFLDIDNLNITIKKIIILE